MIKSNNAKRSEARDYLLEILKKARGKRRSAGDIARDIALDIFETAGLATKDDIRDITDRIDVIEADLD